MKCTKCKSDVTLLRVVEPYDSNLPGVVVDGIERGTCAQCGEAYRAVTKLRELHRLVISSVLNKPWRLAPSEVRWLRLSMNLKAEELGQKFNVTATHISRWETGAAAISALADRLLRMVAASFHNVEPPNLGAIDGERSDPLAVQVTLKDGKWGVDESKRLISSSPRQSAARQSAYTANSRTRASRELQHKATTDKGGQGAVRARDGALKMPAGGPRKSAPDAKRSKTG